MHEIDFSIGRAAVAYTGEKPWHGFGEPMEDNQTLAEWKVAAGLEWSVVEAPIFLNRWIDMETEIYGDQSIRAAGKTFQAFKRIPGKKALRRNDDDSVLSVVSDRFKVVQPATIIDFFESVIKEYGFEMSTAGALRGGKRIWALADTGKSFTIQGDKVGAHLLLATAYDGTFSTTGQFTSIRVVCNNTLSWSLERGGEGGMVKIPHNQDFDASAMKGELGLVNGWFQFQTNVLKLIDHKVTKREAVEYFLTLLGVTEEEAADGKQLANVKKLLSFYESGPGASLPTARDTAWGLVNAVTFLADHGRRAKDNGNRFDSASFGSGSLLKRDAYRTALELVEAA